MKLRQLLPLLAVVGLLVATPGCKDFFNTNVDPLNPTSARITDLLPVAQGTMALNLGWGIGNLSQATSTLVAQAASGRLGSYNLTGSVVGNQWFGLYAECLINNEQVIKQATASGQSGYVGVAKLQKAFVFSQMVDMWGDIPYSEALQGSAIRHPKYDRDSDIYGSLLSLITEGLDNLSQPGATIGAGDLIYNGDKAKWQQLGRTLRLKLLNQIRLNPTPVMPLADLRREVTALLGQPLLTLPTDDFEWKYGTGLTPENRNPGYQVNYGQSSREDFVGRYFYTFLKNRNDPRTPYYFYHQKAGTNAEPTADYQDGRFVTRLLGSTGANRAAAVDEIQTLLGLFPIGGRYDDGSGGNANTNPGNPRVPQRLLTATSRFFTEAELQLTVLNDVGAARAALEKGLAASFAKVNQVVTLYPSPNTTPPITATAQNAYVTAALTRFDAANSPALRLKVIMEEKYVAGFGFGPDIYTDYRRTGYPEIDIPGKEPNTQLSSGYPRVLPYREDDLTSNRNAPKQHNTVTDRLFWDVR